MRVTVVCTGNVARSVALAALLGTYRPDLHLNSAAVGEKAQPGRRAARHMRDLLTQAGHPHLAQTHRSRLWVDLPRPDVTVACAPVHLKHLARLDPAAPTLLTRPTIPDPAFGGAEAYARAWPLLIQAARHLAATLPEGDRT